MMASGILAQTTRHRMSNMFAVSDVWFLKCAYRLPHDISKDSDCCLLCSCLVCVLTQAAAESA